MTTIDITRFGKQSISLSDKALNEHEFCRLAESSLDLSGALVGCGALEKYRVYYLANLALDFNRPFYMSAAAHFASQESEEVTGIMEHMRKMLHERGYYCHHLHLIPPVNAPNEIAFLYLHATNLDIVKQALDRLEPLLVSGGITVVDGLCDYRKDLLEYLANVRIERAEQSPGVCRESFIWWVKDTNTSETIESLNSSITTTSSNNDFVILSYPNIPRGKFSKMCEMAGYRTTTDITEDFHIAIKWFGETFTPRGKILQELAAATHVINIDCEDISKSNVEKIHKTVFGYGLTVDPLTYSGYSVMKANLNAQCRESVVHCPVPEAVFGFVYQRLIITEPEPEEFEEYRVPITGPEIPCVVIKRRSVEQRFDRTAGYATLTSADQVFNSEEISLILEFCRHIGLEFGDLDVLRDRNDGKIYVIDANPTPGGPGGPGGGYTAEQREELIKIQLEALNIYFLKVLQRRAGREKTLRKR